MLPDGKQMIVKALRYIMHLLLIKGGRSTEMHYWKILGRGAQVNPIQDPGSVRFNVKKPVQICENRCSTKFYQGQTSDLT